ncbi:hypothetical protein OG689_07135 [Kitasatospora sp. NBC_00240]|uniref:hypothetical protein n=1 Tax=Kitasatospora sp. NBC_00240 TaxID=2903567 RepID=UPI002256ECCC|nr:hypothetical protein [Kitasatospora sp. NBC_00240]MCX5209062.1 hypothetical protein [Kitasatospora sp. NBC_00240]
MLSEERHFACPEDRAGRCGRAGAGGSRDAEASGAALASSIEGELGTGEPKGL